MRQGNQTVTNGMLKNMEQNQNIKSYGHGAIIQSQANNKQFLDQMIRKNTINSGRTRGNINSTTIRTDNSQSNGGRLYIKKNLSPSYDPQSQNKGVTQLMNQNFNSQNQPSTTNTRQNPGSSNKPLSPN
jgi:hypothetical protein